MKRLILLTSFLSIFAFDLVPQEQLWTLDACMRYAIDNSPVVRKQVHRNDTYRTEQNSSVASFFPSLNAGSSMRYNFGRAIDPETNTYTNTSTFNNYYEGYASMPVFDGGQLVNQFRQAKINRQSGMNDLQKIKDDLAFSTLEAYANVVFYQGTKHFAEEKLKESNRTLYKMRRQEELGLKGKADIAQVEAQVASDDYGLIHQQNMYNEALLKLKELMNYPYDERLDVDTNHRVMEYLHDEESVEGLYNFARINNPTARQSDYAIKSFQMEHLIQKGKLFPSLSLSTGIYTNYSENLKSEAPTPSFHSQFSNNQGQYFLLNLRLPLFNGLQQWTQVRRARNQVRIAKEEQTEVLRQLQSAIEQSVLERDGYAKESIQMEKKLQADELAYQVTFRKFEEGLMSALDLHISSNTLIESKANLLQKQLMYLLKCKQVDYFKGLPIIQN